MEMCSPSVRWSLLARWTAASAGCPTKFNHLDYADRQLGDSPWDTTLDRRGARHEEL